ncbi:MAG: heavy-metal-associated domain-containing protein [Gammaproteobacteria bacterium]|nr:heavy-metal-associated domain-containing protein [Gammaproteobacteria bacterium]
MTLSRAASRVGIKIRACMVAVVLLVVVQTATAGNRATYQVHVDGLACPFCVYGLERSIGKIEGVASVTVSLKTGLIRVVMIDGSTLNEERVRASVEDAGFTMGVFAREKPIAVRDDEAS